MTRAAAFQSPVSLNCPRLLYESKALGIVALVTPSDHLMSAKFIHTADWQIGKNFDRIADDAKRERLRRVRVETIAKIGDIAREKSADFILVAGDLFDSPTADKATLVSGLSAIGNLGIPVIAIPGNHDHGGPGGFWELDFFAEQRRALAPNFMPLLRAEPFETASAWILPCPLLRRADAADPTAWVRQADLANILQSGKPVILLAHGSTQTFGAARYDDEEGDDGAANIIDLARLPSGLVDYAALGDWHGTKRIEPWAWYSGTHEPDRFTKGGDHDPGNVLHVEVERGGGPAVEKIRTASIAWHGMEFEFAGDQSLEVFRRQLGELLGNRVGEDLLQLDLRGALGLEASAGLEALLESVDARLLRLKPRKDVRLAATVEEVDGLTTRTGDPLVAYVARTLIDKSGGTDEASAVAAAALQELFGVVGAGAAGRGGAA